MSNEIKIRTFRREDLPALVALINETDQIEKLERATTLQEMEHEMSFPTVQPETDWFLAWRNGDLMGYAEIYARPGNPEVDEEGTIYCWGTVHPHWRRQGVGQRLLARARRRAEEYLPQIEIGTVKFQCSSRDVEPDRIALFERMGLRRVRYFVNLARPLNGNLPEGNLPAGYRLRTFDPEHDVETVWRVDNAAFRDHWGHTDSRLEEVAHWVETPHMRPELWFLAEETASGEVVGLALNAIDPDWIARTGRREGYVNTLAVLREHRQQGLGRAMLAHSLGALRRAGMEAAHLHADADNLTGAMRLYERLGFRVRKTSLAYQTILGQAR